MKPTHRIRKTFECFSSGTAVERLSLNPTTGVATVQLIPSEGLKKQKHLLIIERQGELAISPELVFEIPNDLLTPMRGYSGDS